MTIKKAYEPIVELLKANENKKVSTILNDILAMCESKKQAKTFIKDSDGKVVAIYCYYHKQWEILEDVPYGSKANSSTGFNTMCKVGTSAWTKAQRIAKKANEELLDNVMNGNIQPSDVKGHKEDVEANRKMIDETNMPTGFANEGLARLALDMEVE